MGRKGLTAGAAAFIPEEAEARSDAGSSDKEEQQDQVDCRRERQIGLVHGWLGVFVDLCVAHYGHTTRGLCYDEECRCDEGMSAGQGGWEGTLYGFGGRPVLERQSRTARSA